MSQIRMHRAPAEASFLQSAEWEAFERSLGRKTWRVAENLVVERMLPFGMRYFYSPRPADAAALMRQIRPVAMREGTVFLKIDPVEPVALGPRVVAARPIQPARTLISDLAGVSEADLLAAMREKTRYNVRLAERKGVEVAHYLHQDAEASATFWSLLARTASRDGFRTHTRAYYEALVRQRSDDFSNELFFAQYRGDAVAAAMVNFYRGTATFLHGASSGERREVMGPHLLHWRIMQEALRRGCARYDWWGIDEARWPGVTRFKRGFGGRMVAYPSSVDVIYRPIHYRAYRLAKMITRI